MAYEKLVERLYNNGTNEWVIIRAHTHFAYKKKTELGPATSL